MQMTLLENSVEKSDDIHSLDTSQLADTPAIVYLASLGSDRSRATVKRDLRALVNIMPQCPPDADYLSFPWHELTYAHTNTLRGILAQKYAPSTANRMLYVLRGVLKAAWKLGRIDDAQYMRATDIKRIAGHTEPRTRYITNDEIKRMLDVCKSDTLPFGGGPHPAGIRDAAVIAILAGGGLRREEVAMLTIENYDATSGALIVQGKGNKERTIYATNGAKKALDAWIAIRGNHRGNIFHPIHREGSILQKKLSHDAIYEIVRRRADQASVPNVTTHDFRHTWISNLFDLGIDIKTIQKLAGHANIETTAAYDRRGEKSKINAQNMVHVPF